VNLFLVKTGENSIYEYTTKTNEIKRLIICCFFLLYSVLACYGSKIVAGILNPTHRFDNANAIKGGEGWWTNSPLPM